MTPEEWGQYLHGERLRKGWTQEEMAEVFGIDKANYGKWERNGVPANIARFLMGLDLLGHTLKRSATEKTHLSLVRWIPDK